MIKYACAEHIDEAIDDVINEEETFPVMNNFENAKCSYCDNQCKYEIKLT